MSQGFNVDFAVIPHPTVLAGGSIRSKGPGLFFSEPGTLSSFMSNMPGWLSNVHVLPFGEPLFALERIEAFSPGGRVLDSTYGAGYILWQEYGGDSHEIWRKVRDDFRNMAKAMSLSLRTIQRIWQAHKLQPHRIRTFKRSTDPDFAARFDDVVGLYMNPPRHAVVVSIDEKSQIQALDRTQPGLPLKRGKCATMTHDYKRNGTTTLFAAFSVLEGKVIGRCVPRHRHQEFIRFIATVERSVPAGKVIHAILDNYAAHKHPNVLAWLADHPRWTFHFTPTSCSWLNAVEGFFSKLTRQSLKRGVFRSVADLEKAITRYIAATNRDPKPFIWTATAKAITTKLALNHPSESVH